MSLRPPPPAELGRRFLALLSRHRLLVFVLIPAIALRVITMVGFQSQMWFNDSFDYIDDAVAFHLSTSRISGYAIYLKILEPFHSLALVTSLQHLMGLAVGVMIYALARHRFRAPTWIATLATLPVLYDGFQIQLEHLIMADVPMEFLIVLAVTIVLWNKRPSRTRYMIAAVLLGLVDLLRSVGLPLLIVLAVYMVVERAVRYRRTWWRWTTWRRLAAMIVAGAIPVVAYMGLFYIENHQFGMTDSTGVFLYARTMTFAECSKMPSLPADELALCTSAPPANRPLAQDYIWRVTTPLNRFEGSKFSPVPNHLAEKFAITAIEDQPLAYLAAVGHDTWMAFGWTRHVFPDAATYDEYLFNNHPIGVPGWAKAHIGTYDSYAAAYNHGNPDTSVVQPFAGFMEGYQQHVFLPGTIYGVLLLLGLGGLVVAWRKVGGPALLPWLFSLALIVTPAATAEFDYRYVLPAVPLACLAGAAALGRGSPAGKWLAARRTGNATPKALDDQRDLAKDTA